MQNERYYYRMLTPAGKQVYEQIYRGLIQFQPMIEINLSIPNDKIAEFYFTVLYDNPMLFHVHPSSVGYTTGIIHKYVVPKYLYTEEETRRLGSEINGIIQKVKDGGTFISDHLPRVEKYLHDSVAKSVAYDYEAVANSDDLEAHTIVGAFLQKNAVCDGISKSFKVLCNEHNIKCIVVIGEAFPKGIELENHGHAWNIIKINDISYEIDVTWDNLGCKKIRYDYYNLTTEEMRKDHVHDEQYHYPICITPMKKKKKKRFRLWDCT